MHYLMHYLSMKIAPNLDNVYTILAPRNQGFIRENEMRQGFKRFRKPLFYPLNYGGEAFIMNDLRDLLIFHALPLCTT